MVSSYFKTSAVKSFAISGFPMCDRGKFVWFAQEQSVNLRRHLRIRRASIEMVFGGEDTKDGTAAVFTYRILFAATDPVDGASDRWA
jgi:hypothetical protein